jgi:hypothetical protein
MAESEKGRIQHLLFQQPRHAALITAAVTRIMNVESSFRNMLTLNLEDEAGRGYLMWKVMMKPQPGC